jgi:hypothetical protein
MNAEKSVTLKLEIKKLVEDVINELEDETIITPDEEDALDSAAKSSANDLKKFAKSLSKDDVQEARKQVNEVETKKQILNEAVGAAVVISILLAAPKALEIITKGMDRLVKTFKRSVGRKEAKTEEEQSELAKRIIKFSHDWHGFYVKIIQFILRISGVYRKANIDPKSPQAEKIAKVIFIVIVIGLGIYGGVQSLKHFYNAFKGIGQLGAEVGTGGLEAALTTIKGTEAKEFLSKII